MDGNKIFAVTCVVLSAAEILFAQPPFRFRQSSIPNSWGYSNEILGSSGGSAFRPPPGLLIAGHGPPVARPPRGPIHAGSRLIPMFASSTPSPSAWPSHGPQIQRAKEASHFEYEVFPHPMNLRKPQPSRLLRPTAPATLHTPIPTFHTAPVPPEVMRILAQDTLGPVPSPRPNARTGRPPHGFGRHPSTIAPTSNPEFQEEGFRILSDIFMEDAGSDIRNNLVGGDISFNGNYYPISNLGSAAITRGNMSVGPAQSTSSSVPKEHPIADLQITPANEHPIHLSGETSSEEDQSSPILNPTPPTTLHRRPQQMHKPEAASFTPPHFQPGPASSHVSFMFTDPNEAPRPYNVYDEGYRGPPPPFHASGNSIAQPQPPSQSDPNQGRHNFRPSEKQESHQPQDNEVGGYNTAPPAGNRLRQQNSDSQVPIMMLPISPLSVEEHGESLTPSSDEVQRALGILARYATKQAENMGISPQQMAMQLAASFNGQSSSSQQPQQSTPIPVFVPSSVTPPEDAGPQSSPSQGPSGHFTTTEPVDAITVSGGQTEESSPFPAYGAPGLGLSGGIGVNEGGGWGSGGDYGGGGGGGGGASDIIGAKVQAIKTIHSAVTGGFKQITGLKAGILNAGLSAIGSLGKAKGEIINSLKIPIVSDKPGYGPPDVSSPGSSHYGPPLHQQTEGPVSTLINGVRGVVGGIAGTVAQTGRAAVGITLEKNNLVKNHFAIKGQAITQTFSKKIANKNQYFQNVLKHVQSIFDSARSKEEGGGWGPH